MCNHTADVRAYITLTLTIALLTIGMAANSARAQSDPPRAHGTLVQQRTAQAACAGSGGLCFAPGMHQPLSCCNTSQSCRSLNGSAKKNGTYFCW